MKTNIIERTRAARRSGFTLVESLIGILLLAVVFTSLYAGVTAGFATIQLARENLRATQILLEKTEAIRLVTWRQLEEPSFIPETFTDTFYPEGGDGQGDLVYSGTFRKTKPEIPNAAYDDDLYQVTFELAWTSGGAQRRRSMTTYISRYGLYRYKY
jgi:prepilin-type N-terminal cleavage/methylation domain-containing protein